MKPCHGRDEGRNSQLEPQLHEEAPPEQPQSPFILMVGGGLGLVGWCWSVGVGVACLVELLVIVQMMLRWEDGKGGEKRILIHTEVDRQTYLPTVSCLLHGERIRKADADICAVCAGFHCVLSAFFVLSAIQPCPAARCRTAPAWEASLTNGIPSEAHDHPLEASRVDGDAGP